MTECYLNISELHSKQHAEVDPISVWETMWYQGSNLRLLFIKQKLQLIDDSVHYQEKALRNGTMNDMVAHCPRKYSFRTEYCLL